MKNDIKKYLTLGAALAGSAFMVSCDGDDVTVLQDTGTADAITDAIGNKPVAPIRIAQFPVTSLKLAFESTVGTCLGASFEAGDEFEIDFDSTTVTTAAATTGNAQGDGATDGSFIFGLGATSDVFVQGITAVPTAATWTINFVKLGTDASGTTILSDLTLTPLSSDQRSVTGRFTATAPVDVNFNQDAANVVGSDTGAVVENLALPSGANASITSVAIYENVAGNDVEVISTNGATQFETTIGAANYGLSFGAADGCVYNFVLNQAAVVAAVPLANIEDGISDAEAALLIAIVNFNNQLDVSPANNQIANPEATPRYLTAGSSATGVTGSYRHDFDSSTGTLETGINSSL